MRKIKGKICKNRHVKLYHISEENHNNRVFKPRIPLSPLDEGENKTIARICFSTSLSGAFRAITFQDRGWSQEYYVHIPIDITNAVENHNVIKPSTDLLIDQEYTSEYWVREKVKMKCSIHGKLFLQHLIVYDNITVNHKQQLSFFDFVLTLS